MNTVIKAFSTAYTTLTILPLPGNRNKSTNSEHFRLSLVFFPYIGLILAGLNWIIYQGCLQVHLSPMVCGLIFLAFNISITGALHIDGLADISDGFGGGHCREKILEIFKDPRHGTFGVTAIVLDLMAKLVLYGTLIDKNSFNFILFSLIISRIFQGLSLTFLPYAGLIKGTAAAFTGRTHRFSITINGVIVLAVCCVFSFYSAALSIVSAAIACFGLVALCLNKINGINGDCIGAINEIAEIAILLSGTFITTMIK